MAGIIDQSKVERDIDDIRKTVNEDVIVSPRSGLDYESLPMLVRRLSENGMFKPFKTQLELLEYQPEVTPTAAKALDTKKVWLWENSTWTDTGLSEYDMSLWGRNNVPMMWFFEPYYEFDGTNLYFKPKPRMAAPTDYCFYIRASKYPNAEIKIDDFYTQLQTQVAIDSFKVTSPSGVTDCIKFIDNQCLYFDHDTTQFIFGLRQDVVSPNRSLMIHLNFNEIGPCIEQANILNSLTSNSFAAVRSSANAHRYASVANSRREAYTETIPENLKKDSNGLVLYDSVQKKLYIPSDTIIYTDWGLYSTEAFELNLKTIFDTTGTSLLRVYFDTVDKIFILMHWSATLSKQQEKSFYLFCSIRHAVFESIIAPDNLAISGTFKYRIDGAVDGVPIDGNKASITAGAKLSEVAKNFPNYDSVNNTLTFPIDTILRHRANIWVMNTASVTVNFTDIQTSAMRVYWDIIENKFVTTRFDTVLNSSQKYRYVTVCAIRDRGNFWEEDNKGRIAIDIGCPYAIDGVLYDIKGGADSGVVQNRLDDTVKAVAHRGYSIAAPENTLPAYILAKKKGYSYAETDINFTSDEVPVLLHDDTIDRTSNGTGNITQMTFEHARQFDFGSWFGAEFAGTKISSLEEFLQLCHKLAIHPYIEIKQAMTITPERAQKLATLVRHAGLRGKVTYISFNYDALVSIKTYDEYARLGFLGEANTTDIDRTDALKTGKNEVFLDCWYGGATRSIMDYALDKDVPVEIWTVNDPDVIVNYANIGVSGVTTDVLNIRQILNESVGI